MDFTRVGRVLTDRIPRARDRLAVLGVAAVFARANVAEYVLTEPGFRHSDPAVLGATGGDPGTVRCPLLIAGLWRQDATHA